MGRTWRRARRGRNPADLHGHRWRTDRFRLPAYPQPSRDATHIPVIACGGAGKPEDFGRVLTEGEADAALAASIFHYGTYTVAELKTWLDQSRHPGEAHAMIIPCIDLMDGKVVQLVQGPREGSRRRRPAGHAARSSPPSPRSKSSISTPPSAMARTMRWWSYWRRQAVCRVGGGVRNLERARRLLDQGAYRVIVGTAAFTAAASTDHRWKRCRGLGPTIVIALDSKTARSSSKAGASHATSPPKK